MSFVSKLITNKDYLHSDHNVNIVHVPVRWYYIFLHGFDVPVPMPLEGQHS